MSDEVVVTTLQVRMEMLTKSISELTESVKINNEKLERLAVLETAHNNSSEAIKRAFTTIENVKADVKSDRRENAAEHYQYNKLIWIAVGFTSAVSIAWSVVGYRINTILDDQAKTINQMKDFMLINTKLKLLDNNEIIIPNKRQLEYKEKQ